MTPDRNPIEDEVLRRVGRNLLLFQQIEHLLKAILTHHRISATATAKDLQAAQDEQGNSVQAKMLGQLVEKYGKEVFQTTGENLPEEDRPTGWASYSYTISADQEFIDSLLRDLKQMTEARNELVHHFLPRWQPDSPGTMAEALAWLDAQRDKVMPMHDHLKSTTMHMHATFRLLADVLDSPEIDQYCELRWLQTSPLSVFLTDVSKRDHRNDGWTELAKAGSLAAKELPEELGNLRQRYGCKTLKRLLLACGIFEVFDEPLSNGHFRTLYRNKATL